MFTMALRQLTATAAQRTGLCWASPTASQVGSNVSVALRTVFARGFASGESFQVIVSLPLPIINGSLGSCLHVILSIAHGLLLCSLYDPYRLQALPVCVSVSLLPV